MKTFIWADTSYPILEYEFWVVTAENLKEAQDMMLDKIQEAHGIERDKILNNKYQDDAHWRYLQAKDDKEERMRIIEECEPIVIECNQPIIITHSNE